MNIVEYNREQEQAEVRARALILLHNIAVTDAITHMDASTQKKASVRRGLKQAEDNLLDAILHGLDNQYIFVKLVTERGTDIIQQTFEINGNIYKVRTEAGSDHISVTPFNFRVVKAHGKYIMAEHIIWLTLLGGYGPNVPGEAKLWKLEELHQAMEKAGLEAYPW